MSSGESAMHALSFSEYMDHAEEERSQWLATHRVGVAEYLPANNTIRLHAPALGEGYYEVDLERCRSARDLVDWIYQLEEKRWFTAELLRDFLVCLRNAFEERYGEGPRSILK